MSYSRVRAWNPEQQKMGWVMRWGFTLKPDTPKKTMTEYKALHPDLTIRDSPIQGLGVFAVADIPGQTILGISHVADQAAMIYDGRYTNGRYHCGYVRTPLGGFINHSDDPNCAKVQVSDDDSYKPLLGGLTSSTMAIRTNRDIRTGEELTVSYTIYKPPRSG